MFILWANQWINWRTNYHVKLPFACRRLNWNFQLPWLQRGVAKWGFRCNWLTLLFKVNISGVRIRENRFFKVHVNVIESQSNGKVNALVHRVLARLKLHVQVRKRWFEVSSLFYTYSSIWYQLEYLLCKRLSFSCSFAGNHRQHNDILIILFSQSEQNFYSTVSKQWNKGDSNWKRQSFKSGEI